MNKSKILLKNDILPLNILLPAVPKLVIKTLLTLNIFSKLSWLKILYLSEIIEKVFFNFSAYDGAIIINFSNCENKIGAISEKIRIRIVININSDIKLDITLEQ